MCLFKKTETELVEKSIAEIIAEKSAGMTDAEKAAYASEIDQIVFEKLLNVNIELIEITAADWLAVAQTKYPTLTDADMGDGTFFTCTEAELQKILSLDWTNLRNYITDKRDCEDFARLLAARLEDYYSLTAIQEVWGDTTNGYHGFNIAVLADGDNLVAKLIEPQQDMIFDTSGPCGIYLPKELK